MSKLRVSDHALVRLLERAGGFDVDEFRANVAASLERAADAAEQIDESEYTITSNGIRYVVRNGVLVTVEYHQLGRPEMTGAA